MSALKDLYSPPFYSRLSSVLETVLPGFDRDRFISLIFTDEFASMELKQRMRHTTGVLHISMPEHYPDAVRYIYAIIEEYRKQRSGEDALAFIFLPDYIEQYGLKYYEVSVQALEFVTQFITCEFAIRAFIIRYYKPMMKQMLVWSDHESPKVRRLASEGSRPRLPWAIAVPALKKDPSDILPILEKLKNDPSEYVRRSVANNLNDISKDHPELMLAIARKWAGHTAETDAIIKHACRGLLKKGHEGVLAHYGLDTAGLVASDFRLHTPEVAIGDSVAFSFAVANTSAAAKTVRLEYGVYYLKANGSLSRKVFKISERQLKPSETLTIERKQSFRIITTKVFYRGGHKISIIINGVEQIELLLSFELV